MGGAVWHYSQGAMTITAEDYVEGVINMTETISERFIVEHVAHSDTHVRVWVYNYGEVDIVVDVYVDIDGGASDSSMDVGLAPQEFREVTIELSVETGDYVSVKAVSGRGNNAYYRYLVP